MNECVLVILADHLYSIRISSRMTQAPTTGHGAYERLNEGQNMQIIICDLHGHLISTKKKTPNEKL